MTGQPQFFNSADVPVAERRVLAGGSRRRIAVAVRYGLWEHPDFGLTLIDTGYGPEVSENPGRSLGLKLYSRLIGPKLRPAEAPACVLAGRGFAPSAVETVILTHFHADHVARLKTFPNARIIACGRGYAQVQALSGAGRLHHGIFRELLPDDLAERLTGFETFPLFRHPLLGDCRVLAGDGSLLAVPLPGHAIGHHGLLWPRLSIPLLYAADVQWVWKAIAADRPPGFPARLVYADARAAMESLAKVRAFAGAGGAVVLCHDPDPGPHRLEAAP